MTQEPHRKRRRINATSVALPGFTKWNLEGEYQGRARHTSKDDQRSKLPLKTSEGLVLKQQTTTKEDEKGKELADETVTSDDGKNIETSELHHKLGPQISKLSVRSEILQAKEELARFAGLLSESPDEHIGLLANLKELANSRNMTVRKLALGTQLAVFKDIIPGYRIRALSKDDQQAKVGKEVKKLRTFEQSLLHGYKDFVVTLSKLARERTSQESQDGNLSGIAISCACNLLTSVPHFNFRNDLVTILITCLSRQTSASATDFDRCIRAIEQLFRDDEDGHISLEVVSQITKMLKSRDFAVSEKVLDTFLHLRLLNEFSGKASTERVDRAEDEAMTDPAGNRPKQKREFRTKRERKNLKERKAVEKEMKEADAAVSHEERDRHQAETLKLVFVAYFRILKARVPHLMGSVLEGLARYAHLINQEFFGDVLEMLKDLIREAEVSSFEQDETDVEQSHLRSATRETLLCITTAFALLQGQTEVIKSANALHLDLNFFITRLYRLLLPLSLDTDIELSAKTTHLQDPNGLATPSVDTKVNVATTAVLLLRSLSAVLLPPSNTRSVPPVRVAAFSKQLLTSTLQLPHKSSVASLSLMNQVVKTHGSKLAALWNPEERKGDGVFNGLSDEVEAANPFATTVWEGEILKHHFDPKIREGLRSMETVIRHVGR